MQVIAIEILHKIFSRESTPLCNVDMQDKRYTARPFPAQSGSLNGKSVKFLPLGFPRGEAGRLDGSSEPARLTDEGWRQVG